MDHSYACVSHTHNNNNKYVENVMRHSSEITIEMLQTLLDSPKLEVLLHTEEKECIRQAIKQIQYLEQSLDATVSFQQKLMADTLAQYRL